MLFFFDTYLYFAQDNFSVSDDTKLSYRQVPVLCFSKIYVLLLLRVMLIFYFTRATDKHNKTLKRAIV